MKKKKIELQLKKILKTVRGKRSRAVIDHIIKFGSVTTEELEEMGYAHAPRAARDVRENGIPLKTLRVRGKSGKMIAAYVFGNFSDVEKGKLGGRKIYSKEFKNKLIQNYGNRCAICNESYDDIYLQIDHRVPYEVRGETNGSDIKDFMLVCATCNRKKSWACEHCENLSVNKDISKCETCFWANPTNYSHIALQEIKRLELIFTKENIDVYNRIDRQAKKEGVSLNSYIFEALKKQNS